MKVTLQRWLDPFARLVAALSIAYSYRNDFVGRVQYVFNFLALICLLALAIGVYNALRKQKDRTALIVASVTGGLFYVGKFVIFSVTAWVVYLISPASLTTYHVPALVFSVSMLTPWLVDLTTEK